jgi:uncharacterized protein
LKFTREFSSATTIRRVSGTAIIIGDRRYTGTIALTPEGLVEDFAPPPIEELAIADLEALFRYEPELVILGTGERSVFPPRELTFAFARRRVGLEVMNTGAAARTFNVLANDGRRLAAILYI